MKHKEADLQKQIVALLRHNDIPVFAVRNERNEGMADAIRSQQMGRVKGAPDLIAGKDGVSYWLELKTDKGRQSPEQKCFEELAPQFGAKYLIVRSTNDIKGLLNEERKNRNYGLQEM